MGRPQGFEAAEAVGRAMQLFWARGYHTSSSEALTAATGLSRSSIYNSFGDKRGLFIAALQAYIDQESQGLLQALPQLPRNWGGVKALLWHVVEAALAPDRPCGCLVVNTAAEIGTSDPEIHAMVQGNVRQVVQAFQAFLQEGQENGGFPQHNSSEAMAVLLFQNMTAIRLTSKVIQDRSHYALAIDALAPIFQSA